MDPQKFEPRVGDTLARIYIIRSVQFHGGECYKAYSSLGRRSVNLLPVAQRTNALTVYLLRCTTVGSLAGTVVEPILIPILMQSDRRIEKGDFRSKIKSCILTQSKKFLFDFSIEQSDLRIPLKKTTFSTRCTERIARSKKLFEAHRISHHPTKHTITPYNSSDAGLSAAAAAAAHSESSVAHPVLRPPTARVPSSDGSSACYR